MENENRKLTVAFDVIGTLIHDVGNQEEVPRYEIIDLYNTFRKFGCRMIVWSSAGAEYAEKIRRKLGLSGGSMMKGEIKPDIAIDDMPNCYGKVNLQV